MMRFGIDIAHYTLGFGGYTGAKDIYNYLVHGHRDSGGVKGGFFTVLSYTMRTPPSYPPAFRGQIKFVKDLLAAADADDYGQRCKIIIKLQALNCFDDTFYGATKVLMNELGPVQEHPSLIGFAIRGLSPGLYLGGTHKCGGGLPDGDNYINVAKVYPGYWPVTWAEYYDLWDKWIGILHNFGYKGGWSGGWPFSGTLGSGDFHDDIFIMPASPSRDPDPEKGPQKTYANFYGNLTNPWSPKTIGTVGGMWEDAWFNVNVPPYYITKEKFEMAFKGFYDASLLYPERCKIMMFYGMPKLTDDPNCPYLDWWLQLCQQYGFFTDYDPAPPPEPISPVTPVYYEFPPYPIGVEMTLFGDSNIPCPPYSQTHPQYEGKTYEIRASAVNLVTGGPVVGKIVRFYFWNFDTCGWELLKHPDGTVVEGVLGNDGKVRITGLITMKRPDTVRGQEWFFPRIEGDADVCTAEGVREDLPILSAEVKHTLTVDSQPIKVQVIIDGQNMGAAPVSVELVEGTHTIEVPREVEVD